MEALWERGSISIREIQESFAAKKRPAYTTVQTTVYRLENKRAVRRARKIGNAHIFEALVTRDAAHGRWIDEVLRLLGGRIQPIVARWIDSGNITPEGIRQAEETLRKLSRTRKDKAQ